MLSLFVTLLLMAWDHDEDGILQGIACMIVDVCG
jgi:hypothetical protein